MAFYFALAECKLQTTLPESERIDEQQAHLSNLILNDDFCFVTTFCPKTFSRTATKCSDYRLVQKLSKGRRYFRVYFVCIYYINSC